MRAHTGSALVVVLFSFLAGCGDSAPAGHDECRQDADCDDGNACTWERCNPDRTCRIFQIDAAVECDDGNDCTADSCDPATGCVHDGTGVQLDCDDGNACTALDICQGDLLGTCAGTDISADCDDGNACTADSCDPDTGCVNDGRGVHLACDDGDACTEQDFCLGDRAGTCAGTDVSADCDDDNPCTADACDALLGCLHDGTGVLDGCDDGEPCTSGDACQGDAAGTCLGAEPTDCDDGKPCTLDACQPGHGCVHDGTGVTIACDDFNVCTHDDTCRGDAAGTCAGTFDDPRACDDGNVCTVDTCDARLGCVHDGTDILSACDDGDACTQGERCQGDEAGSCAGGQARDCDDGNPCTADGCDPASGCTHDGTGLTGACDDGDVCTQNDHCLGDAAGTCLGLDATAVLCDDGNDCTTDSCHPVRGCRNDLMARNHCFPHFMGVYPPRGATLQGDLSNPVITVRGRVLSGAGPIEELRIDGELVSTDAIGMFSHPVSARVGGNELVLEATDSFGSTRRRVQAFLFSNSFRRPDPEESPPDMVPRGIGIWLSQEVLDDSVREQPPDDLATIFEMVLDDLDLGSFVDPSDPIAQEAGYNIYLTSLRKSNATASLTAISGGMRVRAAFTGIEGDLVFDCPCSGIFCDCWWTGGDSTGGVSMNSVTVTANVLLAVNADHSLAVTVASPSTSISGLDVWSDYWWTDILLSVVESFIRDSLVSDLEDELNDQLTGQLAPMLQDALSALAFDESFELPRLDGSGDTIPIQLSTDFAFTDFDPAGGSIGLRATALASGPPSYDNLGFPLRSGCGAGSQVLVVPGADSFELVLADDTLNALFHAAWYGGLLDFPIPPELLGDIDLSAYGIEDLTLALSGMLAPTAGDCYADGALRIFLGDLRLGVSFRFQGMPIDLVVWATATMGLELALADGEIAIVLTGFEQIDTELEVVQDDLVGLVDLIGTGFDDLLVDALMEALNGGQLASIPLPAIDLHAAMPELPPGTVIALDPQRVYRTDGNTIIGGGL
ncbi:MAG: hypothetical protein JXR96_13560 [Deltaproteobacteria bacterium]|nr:hypothetical protein [Deltaproteobacteria bacterium]